MDDGGWGFASVYLYIYDINIYVYIYDYLYGRMTMMYVLLKQRGLKVFFVESYCLGLTLICCAFS